MILARYIERVTQAIFLKSIVRGFISRAQGDKNLASKTHQEGHLVGWRALDVNSYERGVLGPGGRSRTLSIRVKQCYVVCLGINFIAGLE